MANYAASPSHSIAAPSSAPRWLSLGAVLGPILFTAAWLILGFVSPGFTIWDVTISPYSPISAAISGLGLGPTGPYMNAAFVASGALVVIGAIGVHGSGIPLSTPARSIASTAFVIAGIGLALDGIFTLESIMVHIIGFALGIVGLVVGYVVVGRDLRGQPGWAGVGRLALVAGPLTVALTVLYFVTFSPTPEGALTGIAGLTERILVVEAFLPLMVLGWQSSLGQPRKRR